MTRRKIIGTRSGETLRGTSRDDVIIGRGGRDLIFAGAGNDTVLGGRDADVIHGEAGDDRLLGLGGNDHILGGSGNDWIDAGEGDDTIEDGAGSDTVYGRSGNDRIIWTPGSSRDRDELNGGSGQDTLQLEFTAAQWSSAMLRSDVARLQSFIAAQPASSRCDHDREFEFRSYRLEVSGFEKLIVKVGGVIVIGGTDTTPPPPPALALAAASDSGLAGDGRTNDATPTLSGRAEAGAMVRISEGSALLATVTTGADGTWSTTLPALADGPHVLIATATDAAGNISAPSTPLSLTIDRAPPAAPALDLLAADDSGASTSDNLTNKASVRVSVAAEAGSTVQLGGQSGVATGGAATFIVALNEGLNTLSATATDEAGNVSTAGTLAITRDSAGPAAPALDLLAADDSGASASDNLTNKASVRVSVAAEAGSTVQLGGQSAVATGGAATFTVALNEGLNTLSATATDAAGNVSTAGTLAITRDSTGPAAPVLDLLAADDSGASGSDNLTNKASVRVSVAAEAGSTVQLGGQTAVATGGVADFIVALNEGLNTLSATATDAAGNVSTAGALAITRDSTAPASPSIALDPASDAGSQGDGRTSDDTPTLTGMAEAGAVVTIAGADGDLGTVTADASGQWSFTTEALALGSYALTARALDLAGNESAPSSSFALIIEPTVTPGNLALAVALSDQFEGQTDQSGAAVVTLAGTGTAGETVRLFDAQGVELAQTIVDVRGGFRFSEVRLELGENALTAQSFSGATSTGTLAFDIERVDDLTNTNVVLEWVQTALKVFAAEATTPTAGSRALAMMGQAMHNVVAAINDMPGYQFTAAAADGASLNIAVAQAAHDILASIYPGSAALLDGKLAAWLSMTPDGAAETDGRALGQEIAARIIALRAEDGWDVAASHEGSNAPGAWQQTGPSYMGALDPQWANLDPFVMNSPSAFDPGAPPEVGSAEWIAAYNEVKELGASDSTTRTADQTETARFWAQGVGTSTPAGLWAQIAVEASQQGDLSVANTALLFAQLGLAAGDAGIAAWNTKYGYDTWRPVTAIQDADVLGNPDIVADRDWTPYILTPPFPEYVSGHSTFSGAAGEVLENFFGQNFAFSTTAGTFTRSFSSFDAAVEEAGRSRIYGGIHFSFSDAAGQQIGKEVGSLVTSVFNGSVDLTPPTIIFDVAQGKVTAGDLIIAGAASDDLSGVSRLFWSLDGGALNPLTADGEGDFALAFSALGAGLTDGRHTVTIFAQDAAGHASTRDYTFVLSTEAADIILDPAGVQSGATLTAPGELVGRVDLGAGNALTALSYAIDGGPPVAMIFGAGGSFDSALDLSGVALGDHTIVISATDALGNTVQETLDITIDALPFTVTALTPDRNESDVGVTYRPSVSFSRAVDIATLTADSFYVTDASGAKVPATIVPYQDGTGAWLLFDTAMPGAQRMTVHLDGDAIRSVDGITLDANGAAPGVDLDRYFTTVSTASVAGTSITGVVLDPGADFEPGTRDDVRAGPNGLNDFAGNTYLNPLAGVKVFILGREDLFAITDANGRFTLNDTPTGNVKLVVEGRTATNAPDGFYFPEMVMELNVKAGVVNTAMSSMGPIDAQLDNVGNQALYLPRIDSSILKAVSATETTVVQGSSVGGTGLTAEQAALIKLTIAPGSFVDDHGNPVAAPQIGIAPVPASLVRDMLPPGVVNHSFDFTIQAPGTSVFTEEVQLTLPNTFGLAPGSKTNVLSFDHTTGRLVINGTATVSADGLTVTTDPGSGVKAPGWHGITDGTSFGHLDASVLCGTLDPSQLLNMQDVEKGLLNIAGLASTLNLVPQTPEAQIANGLLGVQSDRNAIESTMTSLFNAYYAGDTGSVGGPADASFYAIMGSKLLGQLAKTALDIPGVVVGSTPLANTPAGKTLEVLNKMTNAADLIGNYMLDGSGPISDLNAAAQKLAYQVIVSKSGVPGWVPKSNPLTPAAAQNLRDLSDTAIQNSAAKQAAAQAYIAKVDAIKALVMDFAGPDGEISAAEIPNILNQRAALSSAIADAAQAGADFANLPDPAEDIQAIEDAYNAVQEAFADDLASIIADAEENAGTVPDPDGNAEGAPVYGGTLYYVLVGPDPDDEIRGSFSATGGIDLVFQGSALRADGVVIERSYSLTIIDPVTHSVATTSFKAALAGTETKIGAATLLPGNADVQANGYTAQENYVLGVNGNISDNLVPGVPDAVAISEGLVGTNGLVNGTIASVELADIAQAIVLDASGSNAQGLHAYLATTTGLTVVDVTDANAPKLAAQLQLGGSPSDIAIDKATGLVAVAAGTAGVWLVDVADPDNPTVFAQITGATTQVEAIGGIAYFANQGFLRAYDMGSASEAARIAIGSSAVNGMAVDGDTIYTLQADGTVRTFRANDGALQLLGSALIPELAGESQITVANGVLYVPRGSAGIQGGFATIDVSDPAAPALISDRDALTVTGGALALVSPEVAVGVDTLALNTPLGVRLVNSFQVLNISDPAVNDAQISRFELGAQPVDLAVARGLAFVITTKGLEVVRYANTDLAGAPPVITVDAPQDVDPGTAGIQLREGERISFAPAVTDDISVRQVEMLIDGRVVSTDVTYPYNVTALLPTIAQNGGVATVQISFRAIDTGGNAAVHPGFTVSLVADPTPFTILSTTPVDEGALQGARESLLVVFSKPVDPATVTTANFAVTDANGQVIQPDSIELRNNGATVKLNFASLDAPSYVFLINAPAIRDLAGQALGSTPVQVDFAGSAYSAIWTGGANGDWFNAANWSAGLVPVPADDVFISLPSGAAVSTNGPRILVDTLTTAGAGVLSTGNNGLTATALFNDGSFSVKPAVLNPEGGLTITTLANTGTFTVAAGGDARILGAASNSGAITVAPYGILSANGSIDNSGTITLAVPADVGFGFPSAPILEIKGLDVRLTGGGTIALQQDGNTGVNTGQIQALRAVNPEFGDGFVISQGTVSTLRNVDNTILGAGRLLGQMVLINEAGGEIKAGGHGGTLTDPADGFRYTLSIETYDFSFSPSNTIRTFGQVINRGLIHTADDAQIRFSQEIIDNTGGTIIADGQFSVINLGAGAVVSGGTISAGTNGGIYAEAGSVLRDIHIISTGAVGTAPNAFNPRDYGLHGDIRLGGSVLLDGQINQAGGSSLTLLGGTLTNRGTVWATPGTKIDLAGSVTLDGGGFVYLFSVPNFYGVLQAPLRGDIDPDTGNPLPAHRLINVNNQFEGGGLIGGLTTASGSVADSTGVNVNGRALETFVLENRVDGKVFGSDAQVALTIDGITIQNDGRLGSFFGGSMQLLNTAITQSAHRPDRSQFGSAPIPHHRSPNADRSRQPDLFRPDVGYRRRGNRVWRCYGRNHRRRSLRRCQSAEP